MYSASESLGGFSSVDSGIKDESLADNAYSDGTVTVEQPHCCSHYRHAPQI